MEVKNLSRRHFLTQTGLSTFGLSFLNFSYLKEKTSSNPNIIFIKLDELGYFELSCMGNKKLRTPFIDKMAKEGIRFTQAFAGAPICAPKKLAEKLWKKLLIIRNFSFVVNDCSFDC